MGISLMGLDEGDEKEEDDAALAPPAEEEEEEACLFQGACRREDAVCFFLALT